MNTCEKCGTSENLRKITEGTHDDVTGYICESCIEKELETQAVRDENNE